MGHHFLGMSKMSCRSDLLIFQQMCCTITVYNVLFREFVQNGTRFFFRGQRIWEAVMNELVFKGLRNAKQVITCKQSQLPSLAKKKRKEKNTFLILILYESISYHLDS
jgi:hypothetical protein